MKIATWNVNSVRARLPRLIPWLQQNEPDILCLQETKVEDAQFPREILEDEGYNLEVFGEKTYNGVAILASHDLEAVSRGLPGEGPGASKRVLACCVDDMIVVNLYVPNGESLGSDKYRRKLEWLRHLRTFLDDTYDPKEKIVVTGDFNVTFDDRDVWDPAGMHEAIHSSTPEREALAHVMEFGLHDALRRFHEEEGIYTWWHHRGAGFQRNQGMRIDHFLLSDAALESCRGIVVDVAEREGKGSSDHVPVIAEFADS